MMFTLQLVASALIALRSIDALPIESSGSSHSSGSFPTNIGFLGPTSTGSAPFLAQTDDVAAKTGTPTSTYVYPQPWETAQPYDHNDTDPSIFQLMGALSPYYVGDGWGVYDYALPDQCKIEKVELLSRHGSRYGTEGSSVFLDHLSSARNFSATGNLTFLNDWSNHMGSQILTSLGNQQLFDKGVRSFFRYGGLYDYESEKIVARTTSQERMTMSALYFLNGYFGLNWREYADLEIIIENAGFNNTLVPWYTCPNNYNATQHPLQVSQRLISEYLVNATERLNSQINGVELTTLDLYDMQSLCAYETNTLGYSKFCSLFSQEEWEWYGYIQDINMFYGFSFGNPTSRATGIGIVTELTRRLTGAPYNSTEQSTQNSTLNSNPTYFPTDQSLYLDFTHDTTIVNVLTALGFEQFNSPFDLSGPQTENSTFKSSEIVPFGAQLVFEVIDCDDAVPTNRTSLAVNGTSSTKYVHAILNDHTLPLSENVPDYCEYRIDGWCELSNFTTYLSTLYQASQYRESCYSSNYNVTETVTNGVPLPSYT